MIRKIRLSFEGKSIFTAREQGFVWVEGSKQRAGFLRLFVLLI